MNFKDYMFDDFTLLDEAVILVSVYDYLKELDSIKENDSYNFNGNQKYNSFIDTESLITVLNKEFKSHNIIFLNKKSKFSAITDKNGSIRIFVNDLLYDIFTNNYQKFRDVFESILKHELIHREQSKRINWSKYDFKNQENVKDYYSNKQEIMAYAKNIVDQLYRIYKTNNWVLDFLRHPKAGVSSRFDTYIKLFKKDSNEIKRLYKYMYEYVIIDR